MLPAPLALQPPARSASHILGTKSQARLSTPKAPQSTRCKEIRTCQPFRRLGHSIPPPKTCWGSKLSLIAHQAPTWDTNTPTSAPAPLLNRCLFREHIQYSGPLDESPTSCLAQRACVDSTPGSRSSDPAPAACCLKNLQPSSTRRTLPVPTEPRYLSPHAASSPSGGQPLNQVLSPCRTTPYRTRAPLHASRRHRATDWRYPFLQHSTSNTYRAALPCPPLAPCTTGSVRTRGP